jgi:hypothetical protein
MNEVPLHYKGSILVDIDALFDTRFSTLYMFNKEAAHDQARSYMTRTYDGMSFLDGLKFWDMYQKRDKRNLKLASLTQVLNLAVSQLTRKGEFLDRVETGYVPSLTINYYPYDLSPEEVDRFLVLFSYVTEGRVKLEMVNWSPDEVVPSLVKSRFGMFITYEWWEILGRWTEKGLFKHAGVQQVVLLAPKVWQNKDAPPPSDEEVELFLDTVKFSIHLDLIPVDIFSALSYTRIEDSLSDEELDA